METNDQSASESTSNSPFPPTLWTVVFEATQSDPEKSARALGRLCEVYHQPILAWLLRRGVPADEAQDVAQGFVQFLLEKNRLEHFKRGEARFRSFLLKCLKGYQRDEWRRCHAEKRGGGQEPVDLDETDPGAAVEVDKILDLDCAKASHHGAMHKLAAEKYARPPHASRFAILRLLIWGADEDASYADIGARLQMTTNHVKKAVHDLRHDYHKAFRGVVAESVKPELVDEETRYLLTLLAESGEAPAL